MNRRPIIYDSRFPIGGSRDRRRAFDNDPTETRPALVDHLRRSMGADNFAKAIDLLNAWGDSLLGLGGESEGEGESSAMDSRLDPRPGEFAKMFPDSRNPALAPNAGGGASIAANARELDHRPGQLATLFPDAPNPRTYR